MSAPAPPRRYCPHCMRDRPVTAAGRWRQHPLAGGAYGEACPNSREPAPQPSLWLRALMAPTRKAGAA